MIQRFAILCLIAYLVILVEGFSSRPLINLATRSASHCILLLASQQQPMSQSMHCISGMKELQHYDVILLDMWGVLHDGSKPYKGVLDAIRRLKEAGKQLVILSNSSKRQDHSLRMLRKLGFDPSDFREIITSGEVAYQLLAGNGKCSWNPVDELLSQSEKRKVFVFGSGDDDIAYCESCGWTLAPVEEAYLVVSRGTFTTNDGTIVVNKRTDEAAYELSLQENMAKAAARRLPMLVTNPDKVRPDEGLPPMPGRIGDAYEELLGADADSLVKRIGKPFRDVYDLALQGTTDFTKICMVGDALETDVTGGSAIGIATVWVLEDGIHSAELRQGESLLEDARVILENFNQKTGTYAKGQILLPDYIMAHFEW